MNQCSIHRTAWKEHTQRNGADVSVSCILWGITWSNSVTNVDIKIATALTYEVWKLSWIKPELEWEDCVLTHESTERNALNISETLAKKRDLDIYPRCPIQKSSKVYYSILKTWNIEMNNIVMTNFICTEMLISFPDGKLSIKKCAASLSSSSFPAFPEHPSPIACFTVPACRRFLVLWLTSLTNLICISLRGRKLGNKCDLLNISSDLLSFLSLFIPTWKCTIKWPSKKED